MPGLSMLEATPRVTCRTVALYALLHVALVHLCFSPLFEWISLPLFVATGGIFTYTLLTYLLKAVVLVGGVVFFLGRLRPRDVGLLPAHLWGAAVITLLLWGSVQLTTLFLGQGTPSLHPDFHSYPGTVLLGRFLEAVLGSALIEEVIYRGFLFPQLYLLARRAWAWSQKRSLVFALLVSQLLFGLNHIWAGLEMSLSASALFLYLFQIVLGGLFFAALYLQTGNLFLPVGVHALVNNPIALFDSVVDPSLLVLVFAAILLVLMPIRIQLPHKNEHRPVGYVISDQVRKCLFRSVEAV